MSIDQKITADMNREVNMTIARFLVAVFINIVVVTILTFTRIFATTMQQMCILLLAGTPGAVCGCLVQIRSHLQNDLNTKYFLCVLLCIQSFAVALAGYSYTGTISLLLPVFLAALYPKSKVSNIVSALMFFSGIILPPLALAAGFWDGEYYEFLYDLTFSRQMDTATLSNDMLSFQEQLISAVRYCSSQNFIIIGGFAVIGQLIHRQTDRSFENQRSILRMSEMDELTGLLNRNCFERRLNNRSHPKVSGTVCFYFDINGLHEMNNTAGHKAGDNMLQFVGRKIQEVFGQDNAFRIGGDEYVAFSEKTSDHSYPIISGTGDSAHPTAFSGAAGSQSLAAVKESLEKDFSSRGYYVAIGYAESSPGEEISELVRRAEQEMYQAKHNYYTAHGLKR